MDYYPNELYHHGIKGMKWGVRRYQNSDGSLTAAGRLRYGAGQARDKVRGAYSNARKKASSVMLPADTKAGQRQRKIVKNALIVAGTATVAALAIKHRGAIKAGARIAGKYAKVGISKMSGSAVTKGKAFVSQAKFDANRMKNVANLKTKTAMAKAKVGLKSKANQVKQNAERKRRIGNQVEEAFPGVRTKARNAAGQAKFDAERYGRAAGLKMKTAAAKAKVGAQTEANRIKQNAERRRRIANQVEDAFPGARTKVRNAASQAKFDMDRYGRVASLKTKTAVAKAKVGARSVNDNIARKRRISKQVNDAFNSPSRYAGTHSPSQVRRDVARNLTGRVIGTYAGAAGGAALGNYIERKNKSTKKKKKK